MATFCYLWQLCLPIVFIFLSSQKTYLTQCSSSVYKPEYHSLIL